RYGVPSLGPRTGPSAAAAVADPRYRSLPQLMPEHKANHEPRFHQVPPGEATRISAQAICPFEPDAPQPARRDRGNAGEVFDARARGPDGVDLETVQVGENPALLAPHSHADHQHLGRECIDLLDQGKIVGAVAADVEVPVMTVEHDTGMGAPKVLQSTFQYVGHAAHIEHAPAFLGGVRQDDHEVVEQCDPM